MGEGVPREPREPESEDSGCDLRVWRLWMWVVRRRGRGVGGSRMMGDWRWGGGIWWVKRRRGNASRRRREDESRNKLSQ